jgi:hypothetical protein
MKRKKLESKRPALTLSVSTVRALTTSDLQQAVGGSVVPRRSDYCNYDSYPP